MGRHKVIVERTRSDVYQALKRELAGVEDVEVLLDRRRGKRRQRVQVPAVERRRGDRRSRTTNADPGPLGFSVVGGGPHARKDTAEREVVSATPMPTEAASFLAGVTLFKGLGVAELSELAARLRELTLKKGQALFAEGEHGEEMFLVRRGTIVISKRVTGRIENVLARMEPGDFFGEMSLFGRLPRSATVRADSDATLLALDRSTLEHLIDTNPRAAVGFFTAMVQEFIERLRRTNDLVAEVTRWGLEATGLDVESQ